MLPVWRSLRATPLPTPLRRAPFSACMAMVQLPPFPVSDEQRAQRFFVMDPADRFAEQRRHRKHADLRGERAGRMWDAVGDDQLLHVRAEDLLHRVAAE